MKNIDEFRKEVGNGFFKAKFIKKNGEIREMICRLGVKKHLKGGEMTHNPLDYNNLVVYDMEKKGYRTISFDSLLQLKYNGKELNF